MPIRKGMLLRGFLNLDVILLKVETFLWPQNEIWHPGSPKILEYSRTTFWDARGIPLYGQLGYLPFTWENRKFRVEDLMHSTHSVCDGSFRKHGLCSEEIPLATLKSVELFWICFATGRAPITSNFIVLVYVQDFHPGGLYTGSPSSKYEHRHCCVTFKM